MNKILLKILLITLVSLFSISANAADFEKIKYKNLSDGSQLAFTNNIWTTKIKGKADSYIVKKVPEGITKHSEFYSKDGKFLFSTGTQYEFIYKGALYGYSNYDLKFYEFTVIDEIITQRELIPEEVKDLFPKYKIIKISDFSSNTNSLKIKKGGKDLKIILLNDTDRYFYNYGFTTNNSEFNQYPLKGFLKISKKGLIQFSFFGENSKNKPWYVLLIR